MLIPLQYGKDDKALQLSTGKQARLGKSLALASIGILGTIACVRDVQRSKVLSEGLDCAFNDGSTMLKYSQVAAAETCTSAHTKCSIVRIILCDTVCFADPAGL